ncbi:MAG: ABC transporter permease [Pedobacter sp.]|nr:MAG: ABC transporter permease [Pedobacter sp.]
MRNTIWKITSKGGRYSLKDLWAYRYLLSQLVHRDFVALYKQTILGPIWFLINPILTTSVFCLVFGKLIDIATHGIPKSLFYLTGITAWGYFYECFTRTSTVLKDNVNLFGKIYFPRIIVPISISISMLIRFGIQLILVLITIMFYRIIGITIPTTTAILLVPLILLLIAFQAIGLGLLIASFTIKYRDLAILVSFGLQIGFYVTPVIYPISSVPSNLKTWLSLNPMTSAIELFRYAIIGEGDFTVLSVSYTCLACLGVMILGFNAFCRAEKTFIDTI